MPLTPEEIERVEIEELKHRMEIKEHQRMQKQSQAMRAIGQNDFLPQQASVSIKTAKTMNVANMGGVEGDAVKRAGTVKER